MGTNSSKEADSSTTAGENKEVDEFSMQQQLPDVVVRLIFSKLDFNDIKSCHLVNAQWHRHALDNVNFVLYIEDVGPTRSLRKRIFSSKEAGSRDRFYYKLRPYAATASREALKKVYFGINERPQKESKMKKLYFDRIDAGLSSFKPKIKDVLLNFASSNKRMQPVLQTVMENFPAAQRVYGCCEDLGIVCKFEADKSAAGLDNRAATMKLRVLQLSDVEADDVTATASIIAPFVQQAAKEAASAKIYDVQQFRSLLNELERNSDEATIFEGCKELELRFNEDTNRFDRASSFPSVEELAVRSVWSAENISCADLEQLGNLKHLTIESAYDGLELPSLRLPNLVHLELQRTNLPNNLIQFDSTGLQKLIIEGGENLQRLAKCARNGGCKSLKTLKLRRIETNDVTAYLPAILKLAKGLQTLNISGQGFALITENCIKVAAAAPRNLAELECDGNYKVPVEVGAKQFLRELVGWHQLIGLKTPLVLHCRICEGSQLANGLEELLRQSNEVDGTPVTVAVLKSSSKEINLDMAWANNVIGSLQKLRVRLSIQQQWEFEQDFHFG